MIEKYTGKNRDKRYRGEEVDVLYSLKRCIHAQECVNRLATVFDHHKRPWIDASGDSVESITSVVLRCPSGALHAEHKDGTDVEALPGKNTIILWSDGPVQIHGDLYINGAAVEIEHETRVTLCRCGASANKPFCDNAHKNIEFVTVDTAPVEGKIFPQDEGGTLKITALASGSLHLKGNFEMLNQDGELLFSGTETWLCRCGGSSNKPFCDGTHKHNGFEAE